MHAQKQLNAPSGTHCSHQDCPGRWPMQNASDRSRHGPLPRGHRAAMRVQTSNAQGFKQCTIPWLTQGSAQRTKQASLLTKQPHKHSLQTRHGCANTQQDQPSRAARAACRLPNAHNMPQTKPPAPEVPAQACQTPAAWVGQPQIPKQRHCPQHQPRSATASYTLAAANGALPAKPICIGSTRVS
jgi:hypothetical protein